MSDISGKIIRGVGGFYYVVTSDATIYECRAKGIFRKDDIKPLVGDNVIISILDDDKKLGNIDEILKRKNSLIRPAVANVDQAMVVFSLTKPKPNRGLLDRFLLMMEIEDIPTVICLTKTDLVSEISVDEYRLSYENVADEVIAVSNMNGSGVKAVRHALAGKTTVLAGPSGVGKSSLVNHICPDILTKTGSISEKNERGKHTTRHSELYYMDSDTFICDTPGFTSLSVPELLPEDLSMYMPEFTPYIGKCRYHVCTHIHEPGCAVKDNINITIDEKRYKSYTQIFDELNQRVIKSGRSKR